MRVFNNHKLDILVIEPNDYEQIFIDNSYIQTYNQIKNILKNVDINDITPIQSLELLNSIMRCIND